MERNYPFCPDEAFTAFQRIAKEEILAETPQRQRGFNFAVLCS